MKAKSRSFLVFSNFSALGINSDNSYDPPSVLFYSNHGCGGHLASGGILYSLSPTVSPFFSDSGWHRELTPHEVALSKWGRSCQPEALTLLPLGGKCWDTFLGPLSRSQQLTPGCPQQWPDHGHTWDTSVVTEFRDHHFSYCFPLPRPSLLLPNKYSGCKSTFPQALTVEHLG